jgi:WD40 repeat protein
MRTDDILEFLSDLILTKSGACLSPIQTYVLEGSWQGLMYSDMAVASGYTEQYIKEVAAILWKLLSNTLGEEINKRNCRSIIEQRWKSSSSASKRALVQVQQDWRDAPDASIFFGRYTELELLKKWIVYENCRMVLIIGMGGVGKTRLSVRLGKGGIGKTKLSVRLAQGIQEDFEFIVWRSLYNPPFLKDLLADLIKTLSRQKITDLPEMQEDQISLLIDYLQQHRCLVILDNAETILERGKNDVCYQDKYKDYGKLFKQIGIVDHQSCLLLTSREKIPEVALLEGDAHAVRSLLLEGLGNNEVEQLFKTISDFSASDDEWRKLTEIYNGNPLALELAARHISSVFGGDISEFLKIGKKIFKSLKNLLDWHFNRLSEDEKQLMYWLAINHEPVSVSNLKNDIISVEEQDKITDTIQSLQQKIPLEQKIISIISKHLSYEKEILEGKEVKAFALQPVLNEYILEDLVEQVRVEILNKEIDKFNRYALLKATTKDSVKESQIRFVIDPLIKRLNNDLGGSKYIISRFKEIIKNEQEKTPKKPGYTAGNVINVICQLTKNFEEFNLNFSKLDIRQVYLQGVKLRNIDFSGSHITESIFTNTLSSILSVDISPSGNAVVTGDSKGNIRLWNILDAQELLSFKGHDNWVWSVRFSPDGQTLASGSDDKTVRLWNVKTGESLKILRDHTDWVRAVAFSPDGHQFASGSDDKTIRIWDSKSYKCLYTLEGHTQRIWSVSYSPDGRTLVSGSDDQTVRIWDAQTGKPIQVFVGHKDRVQTVAYSHDGLRIVSGGADFTIRLWSVEIGACINIFPINEKRIWDVALSPDSKNLAVASDDAIMRIYDLNTFETSRTFQGHESRIWSVAFSSNGKKLATGSDDKTIKIWDSETSQCLQTFQGQVDRVWSLAFSNDGKSLANGSEDGFVRIWDLSSDNSNNLFSNSKAIYKTFLERTNWIWSITFSKDDKSIATGSDDKVVKIWNISNGECLKELHGHTNWILSVAFSPFDTNILASGSEDSTVKIWDIDSGNCLYNFEGHSDRVRSVVFSPKGQVIASASDDKTIRLWSTTTGDLLQVLDEHNDRVRSLAFSSDGHILASGSDDKTIRLWSVDTYECLDVLKKHTDRVVTVAFRPNTRILASGSDDTTVRLWNANTGMCLKTFDRSNKGHNKWVRSVAFSPDGQTLATSSQDETIKTWNVDSGKHIKDLRAPGPYEGMRISGVTGLTNAQKESLKALGAKDD